MPFYYIVVMNFDLRSIKIEVSTPKKLVGKNAYFPRVRNTSFELKYVATATLFIFHNTETKVFSPLAILFL